MRSDAPPRNTHAFAGWLDLARASARALTSNLVRSTLALTGIALGVASMTLLVGLTRGAQIKFNNEVAALGANIIDVLPGANGGSAVVAIPRVTRWPLTMTDVRLLQHEGTLLRGVSPIILSSDLVVIESVSRTTTIVGAGPDFLTLRKMQVSRGRFLSEADLDSHAHVVVLGHSFSTRSVPGGSLIGRSVRVGELQFRIVGVMGKKGRSFGTDLDDLVFVPATTLQAVYGLDTLAQILTASKRKGDTRKAVAQIDRLLMVRRAGERTFVSKPQDDLLNTLDSLSATIQLLLVSISAVSLLIGGIGILNVMLSMVTERTREIGIRLAVGARRVDVLRQFLMESTLISLAGGVVGILVTIAAKMLAEGFFEDLKVHLSLDLALRALLVSVTVGILSGALPAWRAATLEPVDALNRG